MTEEGQIAKLCRHHGAAPAQADTMARQLVKRADQLTAQRGCTRVEAMQYLLNLTLRGASGEAPPGFEGGPPPGKQDSAGESETPRG